MLGDQGKERGIKIEILPHHGVHQEKFNPIADGEDQKIAPGDQAQALPDLVRIVHMDPVAHCDQDQGGADAAQLGDGVDHAAAQVCGGNGVPYTQKLKCQGQEDHDKQWR